ncbi:MAG: signal recognition particle receptor subunit alpha [Crenarchaeota archaeon]|nr:signal recognition particle receptor subunit alpha [Thermoproteota archaeon]MCR8470952.1 signal recognition particle receptor subunit alpha [Thermoproteota archaeon]MCR8471788.1 signal recognition particle receptor subunit alpha [Thermoproteota archaeon]MCR8472852.1 signal recognition particle receptor subunit alpha [Thermoproteota archaeon]MCR8488607.1 signal recognition particle receptor subunit alpha [Thermoproteota archaeon]
MSAIFQGLRKLFSKLRGRYIDEKELDNILKNLQRTLIESDVNVNLATSLAERIREKVLEAKIPTGVSIDTIVMRVLYEELVKFLGEKRYSLNIQPGKRNVIVLIGLQGSGKTTTAAKLAFWLKRRGLNVGLICADTYRPAAYDQLKQLAEQISVKFYGDQKERDPIKIIEKGLKELRNIDVIIVDTAGRHKEEKGLMKEMQEIVDKFKPNEVLLVIDGLIGQRAYDQAKAFKEAVGEIGGIIVTKLDGSARGGGALSAAVAAGAPIKFIGTGEHIEEFEPYDPPTFVCRILGLPDKTFLEELLQAVPEKLLMKTAKDLTLKDLRDYYENMLKKEGGVLGKLKEMFSGISEREIRKNIGRTLALLKALNEDELYNVELLKNPERIDRIARGSGVDRTYVKKFIKQFHYLRKLVNTMMRQRGLRKEEALKQIMEQGFDPRTLTRITQKKIGA